MLRQYTIDLAADEIELIPESDIQRLGAFRGSTYGQTKDGRELRIGAVLAPWRLGDPPRKGDLRITREVLHDRPGTLVGGGRRPPLLETVYLEASVVEPGTFARLEASAKASAERKAAAARKAATPHFIDAAEYLPQLDREPGTIVTLGLGDQVADLLGRKSPRLLATPSRGPVRGLAAIRAWIEGHGVELSTADGHLAVKATKLTPAVSEVLDRFAPLLAADVAGKPLVCALPGHRSPVPAWTLAVRDTPACRACVGQ